MTDYWLQQIVDALRTAIGLMFPVALYLGVVLVVAAVIVRDGLAEVAKAIREAKERKANDQ
jgi:hypothetical protein